VLGSEERLEEWEVGETEENPSAARVCNEGREGRSESGQGTGRSDKESLCWGVALGRGVKICREGRISPEKEFDVVSVAVWVGGRVGGELLRDRQCDEGVRPGHRARDRSRLDVQRG